MESSIGTLKIFLGEFRVVRTEKSAVTMDLGNGVNITMHLPHIEVDIGIGAHLPLFTEVSYANLRPSSVQ